MINETKLFWMVRAEKIEGLVDYLNKRVSAENREDNIQVQEVKLDDSGAAAYLLHVVSHHSPQTFSARHIIGLYAGGRASELKKQKYFHTNGSNLELYQGNRVININSISVGLGVGEDKKRRYCVVFQTGEGYEVQSFTDGEK